MSVRVVLNFPVIKEIPKSPGAQRVVVDQAQEMSARCDSDSRVDHAMEAERYRAAVIAGYEPGATAESTRDALLRALDGGGE